MSHSDEPHTHDLTFTDEKGEAHLLAIACPGTNQELHDAIEETGAAEINDLALDGDVLPFERAFDMLGQCEQAMKLGSSYRTAENLFKVFAVMGAGEGK